MSVAEMKKVIVEKVEKLSSANELDIVLDLLDKLEAKEKQPVDIDAIFNKAVHLYGNTLHKLAQ
jgi:hypothetical protein